MADPTTDPHDGQPCAANVDTATVDGADLRAVVVRALRGSADYIVATYPTFAICNIAYAVDSVLAALTAAGWPDAYQPDNPHVASAREARAEVERLRGMLTAAQRDSAEHKAAAARLAEANAELAQQAATAGRERDEANRHRDQQAETIRRQGDTIRDLTRALNKVQADELAERERADNLAREVERMREAVAAEQQESRERLARVETAEIARDVARRSERDAEIEVRFWRAAIAAIGRPAQARAALHAVADQWETPGAPLFWPDGAAKMRALLDDQPETGAATSEPTLAEVVPSWEEIAAGINRQLIDLTDVIRRHDGDQWHECDSERACLIAIRRAIDARTNPANPASATVAYEPAVRGRKVRYRLWLHECGHVDEWLDGTEPLEDSGCDACESGGGRWRPLFVPASPASSPTADLMAALRASLEAAKARRLSADPATPACTCYSGQFGKPHEQGCAALTDATETGADHA